MGILWYDFNMNKDVVYIEPEDDITDILAKLAKAQAKIVALVPPKKIGALRSVVNIKLIAKTAKQHEKVAVLVTTDPTVKKIAASVRIPVAKNLQSRPEIPELDEEEDKPGSEQVIDEDLAESAAEAAASKKAADATKATAKPSKDAKAANKAKDTADKDKKVPDIKKYRKFIIAGAVAGVALIAFLVWAFVFAPAATITVAVRTSPSSFSEAITLTTEPGAADATSGKFLIEQLKYEDKQTVEFTATGEENRGEHAKGKLTLTFATTDLDNRSYTVPRGTTFTQNGLNFTTDSAVTMAVTSAANCDGGVCSASATVEITATEAGENYNLAPNGHWSSPGLNDSVTISDNNGTSGGTTNMVKVVTQADVAAATEKFNSNNEEIDGEAKLDEQITDTDLPINDTLNINAGELTASPAVGEVVGEGTTPTLTATTTYTMFVADKNEIESYLRSRTSLGDNQRIYSFGDPYFERLTVTSDTTYSARLKTTVSTGPEITQEEILEKVKGQRIGDARSLLNSIEGVSDVQITTSFFWVSSIPSDANKITINLINEEAEQQTKEE